ncbi:MAG: chromophore lyase CpcT/CpeT [Gammaproteobacteria bacterium]
MNGFKPLRLAALAACALVASCASEMKLAEADLAAIDTWLPGRYDNVEQAQDDVRQGREPHPALSVTIAPIDVPLVSEHAFYLQESVVDDPRRVTSQRLLTFEVVKGGRIVETVWTLAQPGRWRDGQLNPDLFKSMMIQDATRLGGCELEWKKDVTRFTATNSAASCRVTSPALGSVSMHMRAELTVGELSLAELAYNANNDVVQGNASEPFYRYKKRSNP